MMKIPIYKSELDTILVQDSEELQRILFVMLVWAKTNPFGTVLCEDAIIAKWAGLNIWKRKVGELLAPVTSEDEFTDGYLIQLTYSQSKSGVSFPYYKVLFIEEDQQQTPLFYVKNVDDCIRSFEKYLKKARRCIECGCLLVGNASKYCDYCRLDARRKYIAKKRNEYYWRDKERKQQENNQNNKK